MISTCILSYNYPQLTEQAIASALTYVSAEALFVLHNGSEQKHVEYLKSKFPQITHWTLQDNRGFSGGANEILKRGFLKTDWVLLLTNDCHLLSTPVPPSEPGYFSPKIWSRKVGKLDSTLGLLNLKKAQLQHLKIEEQYVTKSFEYLYVPGSAFFMHKDIFQRTGGFDESLGTYWEDVDFSVAIQKKGLKLGYHSAVEVLHKIGKTCHKDSFYTTYLFQRNRRIVSRRHCPQKYKLRMEFSLLHATLKSYVHLISAKKWDHLRLFHQAIKDSRVDSLDCTLSE